VQAAVEQAERTLAAANSALQAAQAGPHAGQAAARKCATRCVFCSVRVGEQCVVRFLSRPPLCRRAKAEPTVPERISARVASKPRKTYAEDDVLMDDKDRREVFVGAPALCAFPSTVLRCWLTQHWHRARG
jgi:hypothetical protein